MKRPAFFQVGPQSVRLDLDDESGVQLGMMNALISVAGYEPATWYAFHKILRPGDRFVDVGAHVGVLTCLAAALVGPEGRGVAFEPHPGNRAALRGHLETNGFEWVHVEAEAVGRDEGDSHLFRNLDNDGGHALWNVALHPFNSQTRIGEPPPLTVPRTTLDRSLTADIRPVRLLKIDTEGAETDVILGALRTIAEDRPYVIAEVNRFGLHQMQSSEAILRTIMRTRGYREAVLWDAAPFVRDITPAETLQSDFVFNMLFEPTEAPTLIMNPRTE